MSAASFPVDMESLVQHPEAYATVPGPSDRPQHAMDVFEQEDTSLVNDLKAPAATAMETKELYRKIRSILNQLTPQTFQTSITQVQSLVIDTETRLQGVTDIIYEKAISEPAFIVAYANMCRYLLTLKVPSDSKKPGASVNFRVILLTRCQREFEKDNDFQQDLDRRRKAIEEASEDKKAEMKEELETAVTVARRRSRGNIRFIGELFKLKMLKETIMHDCVFKLLRSRDEENLECVCILLSSIGKELDSEKAKPRMNQYFQNMKKIVAEKKVSSECRLMLQDVIDLRDRNWKPSLDENNPTTIDPIHKDAKREAVEQNMSQQSQRIYHPKLVPTGDIYTGRGGHAGGQPGGGGDSMEESWNTVSSMAIRNIDRNIDVSKLRIEKNTDENIQLGPARSFGSWGRGSSGGGSSGGGSRASMEGEKANAPGTRTAVDLKPHRIRLLSWNIDGLDEGNYMSRTTTVCDTINKEKPHVVFLQEVIPDTVTMLEDKCKMYSVIPGGDRQYFTAIMLRVGQSIEYEDSVVQPFSSSRMLRNLLTVKCVVKGVKMDLITSHLESTKDRRAERKRQLVTAFDKMKFAGADRTVIFGGDLNLRDKEMTEVGGIPDGILDLWEVTGKRPEAEFTWDTQRNDNLSMPGNFKPRLRFDRLYLRHSKPASRIKPVHFELVGLERLPCRRFPSDHWGLLAHFDINGVDSPQ